MKITFQELRQLLNPELIATRIVSLIPDYTASDLWRHRAEAEARVCADDALLQLPHRLARVQQLQERPHADRHQDRQRRVEDEVE